MTKGNDRFRVSVCTCAAFILATLWTNVTNGEPGRDTLRLEADGATFELVRVPVGTSLMGSDEGDSDEQPVHEVHVVREFYMGRTEVTVGQYKAFCKVRGYMPDSEIQRWLNRRQQESAMLSEWIEKGFVESDDCPAVCVRWHNATAFCHWLSDRTSRRIRLPSEAEWEHACRAGSTGAYAGDLHAMAWSTGNAAGTTHPVATKQPNAWGLFDMHGSVWEWCEDVYHRNYDGAPADGSAWTTGIDHRRVMRGGGWSERYGSPPTGGFRNLRSAYRYRLPPEHRDPAIGFRIVCEIERDTQLVEGHRQAAPAAATHSTRPAQDRVGMPREADTRSQLRLSDRARLPRRLPHSDHADFSFPLIADQPA